MIKKQTTSMMLLVLYALLIVALLVLVVMGARLYSSALDAKNAHSSRRIAISYIQSQAGGFSRDRVELRDGPEGRMLCMQEAEDGYETRIYLYEGTLRAEFSAVDSPVDPAVSQKICDLEELDLYWQEMSDGLLHIEADGTVGYISLRRWLS